jgi:hypothetical protein
VSELEVFNKTHRRNGGTGEFISERAKRTVVGAWCSGRLFASFEISHGATCMVFGEFISNGY